MTKRNSHRKDKCIAIRLTVAEHAELTEACVGNVSGTIRELIRVYVKQYEPEHAKLNIVNRVEAVMGVPE